MKDPSNALGIAQVSRPPWSGRFHAYTDESVSFGHDTADCWFRFQLAHGQGEYPDLVLAVTRPLVSEVEVFIPVRGAPSTDFRRLRAGLRYYDEGDDLKHRLRAVALPTDIQPDAYIYLRVRAFPSPASYAVTLFSRNAFIRYTIMEYLFFGVTTGIILAMLLYNLSIAFFLRDRVYTLYCVYLAAMIVYSALLTSWPLGLGMSPDHLMGYVLKCFALTMFFGAFSPEVSCAPKGGIPSSTVSSSASWH